MTLVTSFFILAQLTYYNPALGGINCDTDCLYVGTGNTVAGHYGEYLACPLEFPRWTRFVITDSKYGLADGTWWCADAGNMVVVREDGVVILDLLTEKIIYNEIIRVKVILPDGYKWNGKREVRDSWIRPIGREMRME